VNVTILGSGPAGLVAAHAATLGGHNVVVVSKEGKSALYGAQYLHAEIPGIDCGEPHPITVRLKGTADDYRRKVYGEFYRGPVSPEAPFNGHSAWDIRKAYNQLWDMYVQNPNGTGFNPVTLTLENIRYFYDGICQISDVVLCSIPLMPFCVDWADESQPLGQKPHNWISQKIYAIGDAPERNVMCPVPCPDFTIEYNGTDYTGWYRSARIFGHTTCEWPAPPGKKRPPLGGSLATVTKPISTNCTCWPKWTRIGRYGEWRKGVLVHEVFDKVTDLLKNHQGIQDALF
jgi:hypothetical protein